MKEHLTKFLLVFAAVVCFSLSVSAQKTNDKKGERKPPKIIVPDKKEKPKDDKSKEKDKKNGTLAKSLRGRVGVSI